MPNMIEENNGTFERSVIAYAFLAQTTRQENDLFSGLTPIFKPIAKMYAGDKFDAQQFSNTVNQLYGLRVHPWAVEDLIPRLENAGLLTRIPHSDEIHELVYAEIEQEFDEVTEKDIQHIIHRFVEFSAPTLMEYGLSVDRKSLEEGFLSQLVDMSFVSVLLKPDRTKEDLRGKNTLSFKKPQEQSQWEEEISVRAKIDVLCASFIVDAFHCDRDLYDLVMRIATGAILSEVVLNLQDPGDTGTLRGLNVALDAPFLMALLNLTSEEGHAFASEICQQLREKHANIVAYDHSVEELKGNLKAVINKTKEGVGFGPTARRLSSSRSFEAYANTVLQSSDTVLKKANVRVVSSPKKGAYFQFFSQEDQERFRHSLGFYQNEIAQDRDAESVAATVRLRRGKQVKMGRLPTAEYLFVTENTWVVDQSVNYLRKRNMFRDGEVPPVVSEKYLAGLLWALYGGKGSEMTKHLLLANCAAALEPRSDVVAQMHRFLTEIDDNQAEVFSALMTEERAGQYAMQMTLGDSSLITKDNAAEIVEKITAALVEKHEVRKKIEIDAIRSDYDEELRALDNAADGLKQELLDARGHNLKTTNELRETQARVARIEASLYEEKIRRVEDHRRLLERCIKKAKAYEGRWHLGLGIVVATIGVGVIWFDLLGSPRLWVKAGSLVLASLPAVLVWKVPEYLLGGYVHRLRMRKLRQYMADLGLSEELEKFLVDWNTEVACLRNSSDRAMERTDEF